MKNDLLKKKIINKYFQLLKKENFSKNNALILVNSLKFNLNIIFYFKKHLPKILNYLSKHSNKKNFNLYEYSRYYECKKKKFKRIKSKKLNFKSFFLGKLGFFLIRKIIVFSGGWNALNKIYERISYYYLEYFLDEFKTEFNKKIYFDLKKIIEKSNLLNPERKLIYNILKNNYCRKKREIIKKDKLFLGAPINFLLKKKYLKFCFIINNIKIIGVQHGNGGALYMESEYYDFEKKISQNYLDWFPVRKSKIISRYGKQIVNKKKTRSRIFIIGQSKTFLAEKFLSYSWSKLNLKSINNNYLNYISKNFKNVFLLKHPFSVEYSKKIKIYKTLAKAEKIINKNDVIIFHNITGTLLFYAIKLRLKFLIYLNYDYKKLNLISYDFKNLLNILEKKKILFSTKNKDLFYKQIRIINNQDINQYNSLFKDLKDLKDLKIFSYEI